LTVIVPNVCGIAPACFSACSAPFRQAIEPGVAGRDRAVGARDADDRLGEVVIAKSDRAQHGAIGRALEPLGHRPAAKIVAHDNPRALRPE